ncbi:MAG: ABC transporter ATP-binding protein [bacterium]|nr:ABC transporter ATP-binding protein [bacterium]
MLVETHELTKAFGDFHALRNCTIEVAEGQICGLLGPNGAGKSTLLRLLLGFIRPTSGWAKIDGLDCFKQRVAVHQHVAYLPGDARLYEDMQGRAALKFFADIRSQGDFERSLELADRLELDLKRQVAYMSTGMRQKLALAAVLAFRTPLLILDEPTANLDPTVRADILALVAEAGDAGKTVIFSSHVLSEVEEICDRVIILRKGELVHTQSMAEIKRRHQITARFSRPLPSPPSEVAESLTIAHPAPDTVVIETPNELAPLLGWLGTLDLTEMAIEPVGLRRVYERFHPKSSTPKPAGG